MDRLPIGAVRRIDGVVHRRVIGVGHGTPIVIVIAAEPFVAGQVVGCAGLQGDQITQGAIDELANRTPGHVYRNRSADDVRFRSSHPRT